MYRCVNCDLESSGSFCPSCGQTLQVKKLTFKAVASEITDKWLGLDTKFARTFLDLTLRPSLVLQRYLNRNTVKYIGPLGYYIVVTALMILVFDLLKISIIDFLKTANNTFNFGNKEATEEQRKLQEQILNVFSSNFRFVTGLIVPFAAVGLIWVFRKSRNYLENLVMALFLEAHAIWLTIVSVLFYAWLDLELNAFIMPISIIYFSWGISRFYKNEFRYAFVRAILAWLIGFFLFVTITAIVSIVVTIALFKDQI